MYRYPLRIIIPLLLGVFGLAIAFFSYLNAVGPSYQRIEGQHYRSMQVKLTRIQGVLESFLKNDDYTHVQRFVSSFGSDEAHLAVVLVNKSGNITSSTDLKKLNEPWKNQRLKVNDQTIEETKKNRTISIQLSPDKSEIYGVISLCGSSSGQVLRNIDCGFLYLAETLKPAKAKSLRNLQRQAILEGLGILFIASLLLLVFDWLLTRRVRTLLNVTNDFSIGNLESRSNFKGQDELATIGQAVDEMLSRIIQDQTALRKALKDIENQKYVLDRHALVATTDKAGVITYANDKFCTTSGYKREELIGNTHSILKSSVHPPQFYSKLWEVISQGHVWNGEICNKRKDGSHYWVESTIAPLRNEQGVVTQYIAVRTDITKRKLTESQLRQAQKMEAMGQLTGGIAHDFNNILAIILGNLEILEITLKDNDQAIKRVKAASNATSRGAQLTEKLLSFARVNAITTEVTSANTVIEGMSDLISKSLTSEITFKKNLSEDAWSTAIDPGDLQDALLNLTLNARDAMPEGGDLTISTENITLQEAQYDQGHDGNKFVMISVCDTGEGMPENVVEKILEPFYTTKPLGKGTGLGLSMVHGFVKRAKGFMKVSSSLGEGTTIKLYLPQAEETSKLITEKDKYNAIELPQGSETILIVDDESYLCDIAASLFSRLGYKTFIATNGPSALNILSDNPQINLLFSDVEMLGGMDGYELATQATKTYPNLKVLLTSGYSKNHEKMLIKKSEGSKEAVFDFIKKPYDQSNLAKAIRTAIDH